MRFQWKMIQISKMLLLGHREDGEFEVVTSRPRLMDTLPHVQREEPLCQLVRKLDCDHTLLN